MLTFDSALSCVRCLGCAAHTLRSRDAATAAASGAHTTKYEHSPRGLKGTPGTPDGTLTSALTAAAAAVAAVRIDAFTAGAGAVPSAPPSASAAPPLTRGPCCWRLSRALLFFFLLLLFFFVRPDASTGRERERGREPDRQRDRETETETEIERQRQTDRQTGRQTDREQCGQIKMRERSLLLRRGGAALERRRFEHPDLHHCHCRHRQQVSQHLSDSFLPFSSTTLSIFLGIRRPLPTISQHSLHNAFPYHPKTMCPAT